jgi:hypothetical protein
MIYKIIMDLILILPHMDIKPKNPLHMNNYQMDFGLKKKFCKLEKIELYFINFIILYLFYYIILIIYTKLIVS